MLQIATSKILSWFRCDRVLRRSPLELLSGGHVEAMLLTIGFILVAYGMHTLRSTGQGVGTNCFFLKEGKEMAGRLYPLALRQLWGSPVC
jgi:hypothetical protein